MGNKKKYQMDMCHGSLFRQIFQFSLPLMGTNIMALLFHASDLVVLGQFASPEVRTAATAAVGATSALYVLFIIFFSGFSAGVNAIAARYIGAKNEKKVVLTVHSSIALGLYGGIIFMILGVLLSETALRWMGTPEDVLPKATIYLQIYSIGIPFAVLYMIGAALLRAVGDTKRPLIYITVSGVVNVVLNLFFVTVCKMDAAGVAIATKISTLLSGILILRALCNFEGALKLNFRKLRFHWETLKEILWIGVPAGFQGALYTVSNVFIQSSVNSLGSAAMAGNAASQSLEGLINVVSSSYYQTAMSFSGQNFGGHKYKRVVKSILICLFYTAAFLMVSCGIFLIFGRQLLGLYNPDTTVINWGMERLVIMMCSYFLCGISDTITGALRGLGYSVLPTITTIMGTCVLRIVWIFTVFPGYRNLYSLIASYPVSWTLIALCNGITLFFICRNLLRQGKLRKERTFTLQH